MSFSVVTSNLHMNTTVLWDTAPCTFAKKTGASEVRTASVTTLMMEAIRRPETSIDFYQTTRCFIPYDCCLQTLHRENLKYKLHVYTCKSSQEIVDSISDLRLDILYVFLTSSNQMLIQWPVLNGANRALVQNLIKSLNSVRTLKVQNGIL
jgi:hypothetical protein